MLHVNNLISSKSFSGYAEFVVAFLVATVVSYEGFFVLFTETSSAGSLNPYVAVFIFSIGVMAFIKIGAVNWYVLITFLLTSLFFFLGAFIHGGGGSKFLRDIVYLIVIFCFFSWFYSVFNKRGFCIDKFSLYLGLFTIVFYPLLGMLHGFTAYGGRFSGFGLSPPVFANSVLLAYLIYRGGGDNKKFIRVLYLSLSFVFIVLSGTRSAMIMLLIYEVVFLFISSRRRWAFAVFLMLLIPALFFVYFHLGSYELRVFSTEDLEGGSLSTRLYWYSLLLSDIIDSSFIGGFGPGAAENRLGYIPHFDILRLWYDYSVLCLITTMLFWGAMIRASGFRFTFTSAKKFSTEVLLFAVSIVNLIFLSMHNAFQIPGLILLIIIWMFFFSPPVYLKK